MAPGLLAAALLGAAAALDGGCGGGGVAQRSPNVVIVVLDAARADHFGVYGYERDTTAHFDALTGEAVVFDRAIANASFTTASVASLLTGETPAQHGLVSFGGGILGPGATTLAEVLRGAGYRTAAFTENPLLTRALGYGQGFETYQVLVDDTNPGREEEIDLSESPTHVERMMAWWGDGPREVPVFLYAHLLRPHNHARRTGVAASRIRPG